MTVQNNGKWILFAHWNESEAIELAQPFQNKDWNLRVIWWGDMIKEKEMRENPPAALVISLRRLPSHGRHMGEHFRSAKWGKETPIIYFDGQPEKVANVREKVPDAIFISYQRVLGELENLMKLKSQK